MYADMVEYLISKQGQKIAVRKDPVLWKEEDAPANLEYSVQVDDGVFEKMNEKYFYNTDDYLVVMFLRLPGMGNYLVCDLLTEVYNNYDDTYVMVQDMMAEDYGTDYSLELPNHNEVYKQAYYGWDEALHESLTWKIENGGRIFKQTNAGYLEIVSDDKREKILSLLHNMDPYDMRVFSMVMRGRDGKNKYTLDMDYLAKNYTSWGELVEKINESWLVKVVWTGNGHTYRLHTTPKVGMIYGKVQKSSFLDTADKNGWAIIHVPDVGIMDDGDDLIQKFDEFILSTLGG